MMPTASANWLFGGSTTRVPRKEPHARITHIPQRPAVNVRLLTDVDDDIVKSYYLYHAIFIIWVNKSLARAIGMSSVWNLTLVRRRFAVDIPRALDGFIA